MIKRIWLVFLAGVWVKIITTTFSVPRVDYKAIENDVWVFV